MAKALSQSVQDTELQYEMLASTRKHILQTNPELAESLSDTTDEMILEITNKAYKAYIDKNFKKAEKYYLMAVENKDANAMFNLALLYTKEYKDFKKAEKYYLIAIENKHAGAMFNLALLYESEFKDFKKAEKYYLMAIENDFKNNMEFLLQTTLVSDEIRNDLLFIFEKYHTETNYISAFALSIISVNAEKYKESIDNFNLFLDLTEKKDDFQKHITNFFILLISRKQYHLAFKLFQEEKYHLKEKVKPVYYALMNLMKEEYPKEYKRMGGEVSDTVYEILEAIKALEKYNRGLEVIS